MSSARDATVPATRHSRRSTGGQSPSRKAIEKENATVDIGSTHTANRKKSRSKSMGPGGLDVLKRGTGNRREVSVWRSGIARHANSSSRWLPHRDLRLDQFSSRQYKCYQKYLRTKRRSHISSILATCRTGPLQVLAKVRPRTYQMVAIADPRVQRLPCVPRRNNRRPDR